jgi:glucose-6-phosphate isomerase
MGGSSLAPEVFRQVFGPLPGGLTLHVLDSTEPLQVAAVERAVDPARTLFILSTKSGATIETLSLFKHFHARQGDGRHWIAITDPGSTLLDVAEEHGFRRAFCNDPEIGGRYSALSYFGLVPAALLGVDVEAVLDSAQVAMQTCEESQSAETSSGLWLGLVLGELALRGRDKLTLVADAPLASFGLWAEQLVAESTGKHGTGILPVAGEPLAEPGAYGSDRVFVHLVYAGQPDESHAAACRALMDAGHPVLTVRLHERTDLGRLFFMAEFATAVAGWVLGINPFDQPDVQEAKDNARRVLADGAPDLEAGELSELVLEPPGYLAILGYLPYGDEIDAAVTRLRRAVLERFGTATTWGFGPRYLHSTGQLHKGGPASGSFLELVHDATADEDIPGEAYGFRGLVQAQADGDLQTLRAHGRPAVRVMLPADDIAGGIDRITERLGNGGSD